MRAAKAMKRATTGFGLRQRLLLSFIAISGFAMVAAVVGNYAFYATGEALHQVTEKSVPPAIATLEFAQRTEPSSPPDRRCWVSPAARNSTPFPPCSTRN
jgi:hypothetical protein